MLLLVDDPFAKDFIQERLRVESLAEMKKKNIKRPTTLFLISIMHPGQVEPQVLVKKLLDSKIDHLPELNMMLLHVNSLEKELIDNRAVLDLIHKAVCPKGQSKSFKSLTNFNEYINHLYVLCCW